MSQNRIKNGLKVLIGVVILAITGLFAFTAANNSKVEAATGDWTWSSGELTGQTSDTLPTANVGHNYNVTFSIEGYTEIMPNVQFSYSSTGTNQNPNFTNGLSTMGISLNGKPQNAGTYSVNITVDSTYNKTYTLTVKNNGEACVDADDDAMCDLCSRAIIYTLHSEALITNATIKADVKKIVFKPQCTETLPTDGDDLDDVNGKTYIIGVYDTSECIYTVYSKGDIRLNPDSGDMFSSCTKLVSIDNFEKLDSNGLTELYYTFRSCSSLKNIDLSKLDTSLVTSMYYMFGNCTALESLDLSSFDTSSVTSMYNMFSSCSNLVTIDLTSFDTSNVAKMQSMFLDCGKLEYIYVSENFVTTNVTNSSSMFNGCFNLKGQNGTTYSSSDYSATYAKIDKNSQVGYFSEKYPIIYNTDGGSTVDRLFKQNTIVLPASNPTKNGYIFEGWYTNSGLTTNAVAGANISAATTLYAKWTEVITTQPQAGTNNYTVVVDTSITGATYQWYKYVDGTNDVALTGETDAQLSTNTTLENSSYYCKVIKGGSVIAESDFITPKAITFNANGGTGTAPSTMYQLEGRSVNLPTNTFTAPNGKLFEGWATSSTGNVVNTYATLASENTIYAIWKNVITTQPQAGTNNYTVVVDTSITDATYQWYKYVDGTNDVELTGETGAQLSTNTTLENSSYYCKVLKGANVIAESDFITPKKIEFDVNRANENAPSAVYQLEGRSINLATSGFTATDFVLAGWSDGVNDFTSTYTVGSNNVTLNATWKHEHGTKGSTGYIAYDEMLDTSFTGGTMASGNYVLDTDLVITSTIEIPQGNTVNICLNGHVITGGDFTLFDVSGTLNITDCKYKDTNKVNKFVVDNNESSSTYKLATYNNLATSNYEVINGGAITGVNLTCPNTDPAKYIFNVLDGNISIENIHFVGNKTAGVSSYSFILYATTNGNHGVTNVSIKNVDVLYNNASSCFKSLFSVNKNVQSLTTSNITVSNNNFSYVSNVSNNSKGGVLNVDVTSSIVVNVDGFIVTNNTFKNVKSALFYSSNELNVINNTKINNNAITSVDTSFEGLIYYCMSNITINTSEINSNECSMVANLTGGLVFTYGNADITNLSIKDNSINSTVGVSSGYERTTKGGLVYIYGNGTINNSTFYQNVLNTNIDINGGILYVQQKATITNTVFELNEVHASTESTNICRNYGGLIQIADKDNSTNNDIEFNDVSFKSNKTSFNHISYGGLIYVNMSSNKSFNTTKLIFDENEVNMSSKLYGGLIYVSYNGDQTFNIGENSRFYKNSVISNDYTEGGLIYSFMTTSIKASFTENSVTLNSSNGALNGGLIQTKSMIIKNANIIGNQIVGSGSGATSKGGIISIESNNVTNTTLVNVLIKENSISNNGAIEGGILRTLECDLTSVDFVNNEIKTSLYLTGGILIANNITIDKESSIDNNKLYYRFNLSGGLLNVGYDIELKANITNNEIISETTHSSQNAYYNVNGGLINNNGKLILNSTIYNNTITYYGNVKGGMIQTGELKATDVSIKENTIIAETGLIYVSSYYSDGNYGNGAMIVAKDSTKTSDLTNVEVKDNNVKYNHMMFGGLFRFYHSVIATGLKVTGNTITQVEDTRLDSRGLILYSSVNATIDETSVVDDNEINVNSNVAGGLFYVVNTFIIKTNVTNNVVNSNNATRVEGGLIYAGILTINDISFTGNSVSAKTIDDNNNGVMYGGLIYFQSINGMDSITFNSNIVKYENTNENTNRYSSISGGIIYQEYTTTLGNSLTLSDV